ncbi:NAD(P)H-binding protein [Glycomyces sp. NRRL B-16210]|uniref:NAD(P)H-binding protein n=1 Tax=Glycomyces sp. NRRL B-16210 TaxID=1463821 RepID=UPI0004C13242|nr:NAD(P)H-binding protein [Glycomyces sp. NRRL B-16210]
MILVTGATGSTGRYLVRQLVECGAEFRALVRDKAKGEALGVDYAVGDYDDPGSLAAAMEGVDRVYLASPGAQAETENGEQPMIRWEKNVIDAAKRAGAGYVVKLSVLHARIGGRMSEGGHGAIEAHLKESGLEWTILQPGGFMQNFLSPTASLRDGEGNLVGHEGDAPVAFIDAYDVAACAATLLTGNLARNETLPITGPEAIAYSEVAAKLSAGTEERIGFNGMSERGLGELLRGFGLAGELADELASLYASIGGGSYSEVTDVVERITGNAPRSFEAFMAANPEAFPQA